MSKQRTSSSTAPSKASKTNPSPRRKYLLGALILLLLGGGAYYFWGVSGVGKGNKIKGESGAEPTLTAKNPRLQLLTANETGVDFQNNILEDNEHNVIENINQYNGGGVAIADINNDQLPDIYFVSSSGKNRLYLNEGNFKFKDITDASGVGSEDGFETSATAVDVNADGWLDFFVCRAGMDVEGRVANFTSTTRT